MKLRPYKPCDAETILSWIRDETTFRRWSTDRYDHYPITAADMNHKYMDLNGDCVEPDNFSPMTAVQDGKPVGHMIMRYTNPEQTVLRFGFIILDDAMRGKGYGKQMLRLAMKYAFEIMGAEKVTLGVLANNPNALHCYQAAGLRLVEVDEPTYYPILGEQVLCLELEADSL